MTTQPIPPIHFSGLEIHALDREGKAEIFDDWRIRSFQLEERLCEPFSSMLSLATADLDLAVPALVGGRATFRFGRGSFERQIQGIVWKAETIGVVRRLLRVRLWIAPALQVLSLSKRPRVFQGMTVLDIVRALVEKAFDRYGGTLDATRLEPYLFRKRDYCVQYDETDLELFMRLLAEESITFSFRHEEGDAEQLVLMPMTAILHSAAGEREQLPRPVPLVSRDHELAPEESIQTLRGATRMRAQRTEMSLWDWKATPPATVLGTADPLPGDAALPASLARFGETYEHEPYRPVEEQDGAPLWQQLDGDGASLGHEHRLDDARAIGTSNAIGFTDGATFELDHPTDDLDGLYALLAVTHFAEFRDGADGSYNNTFTCHRFRVRGQEQNYELAPTRRPRPRAHGPMMATVVGPEGEEIHTDEHGRIKVRMHWDREGIARGDHETSCWVPVAQVWAGPGYGAMFIPRVGMDVVISFIVGDLDRPICTGAIYDGGNPPPYPLPANKTRSGIKTASSVGGNGFNELSFEDARGREEIFVHAQRNLREVVRASHTAQVGGSRSTTIGGGHTRRVGHSEEIHVGEAAGSSYEAGAPASYYQRFHVAGAQEHYIRDLHSVQAKGAFWAFDECLHARAEARLWLACAPAGAYDRRPVGGPLIELTPTSVAIEANEKIELAVGETKLVITPGKIELHGAAIELVSAGGSIGLDLLGARIEGTHVDAIGGGSRLELHPGEARIEGTTALLQSGTKTTVRSLLECAVESMDTTVAGLRTTTVTAPDVSVKGSTIASHADAEHTIKGKPVRIN